MEAIYNDLKVKVSEQGDIINIEDLIEIINNATMSEDLKVFLNNLENRIANSTFKNKAELSAAIKSRLLEYEANKQQENVSNLETLRMMQSINADLSKLGIISTKKAENDSNKDIDYLTYTNEAGEVEVLVCGGDNTLNEYIKDHADVIANYSAKDIFHHFKEYIHKNLSFSETEGITSKEAEENEREKSEVEVREDQIRQQEYETVKEYADKYSISDKIEITIDPNGERIYRVKDGLFKFKTENNMRVMQILQTPSINLSSSKDLLDELERDENEIEEVETNIITDGEENKEYNYDTLPNEKLSQEDIEKIKELIQRRDIYEEELTAEELLFLDKAIKELIETMPERAKVNEEDISALLADIMKPKMEKYDSIQEGIIDAHELSELETKMCERYIEQQEYIIRNNIRNTNNKKLELKDEHKESDANHGVATIVMLFEIMMLALFILFFQSLDI